jgi:hypothetical protein
MGSTEIINKTSRALDMKVGDCRHFIDLATVERNQSYTVQVHFSDTYMEFSLGTDATGKTLVVNSDECVDNRRIVVQEVDGRFHVEMEPRVASSGSGTDRPPTSTITACEPPKKRPYSTFWRLRVF